MASQFKALGLGYLAIAMTTLHTTACSETQDSNLSKIPNAYVTHIDFGAKHKISELVALNTMVCALLENDQVRCWNESARGGSVGMNNSRPVDFGSASTPKVLFGNSGDTYFETGYHACAVLRNGEVRCWGAIYEDTVLDAEALFPRKVFPGKGASLPSTALKQPHADKLKNASRLFTDYGIVCGTVEDRLYCPHPHLQYLNGKQGVQQLIGGEALTCLLYRSGARECFSSAEPPSPVKLSMGAQRLVSGQIMGEAALHDTCELGLDKNVYCMNWPADEPLSVTAHIQAPGQRLEFPRLAKAVALKGAMNHACALLDNGSASCWGANDRFQLGYADPEAGPDNPGKAYMPAPGHNIRLGRDRNIIGIALSLNQSCFLVDDGTATCVGTLEADEN